MCFDCKLINIQEYPNSFSVSTNIVIAHNVFIRSKKRAEERRKEAEAEAERRAQKKKEREERLRIDELKKE